MTPSARRAVALGAYVLLVLAFFEGTSRLVLSWDPALRKLPLTAEASWRLRWIHSRGGWKRSYPFDKYHPIRGWALRRNLRGMPVFGDKVLSSNSRGLRGAAEHGFAKPEGVTRILVFGDSFTFGDEVGDDETYPAYLQRKLPAAEILNFGVHGYGHDQMLLYLRDEGVRYQADVVVLAFVDDDVARNGLEFRDYAKPRFLLDAGHLALRNVPVPTARDMMAREGSRFVDLLSILFVEAGRRVGWIAAAREEALRGLTAAILDEMRATILAMGARPVFVHLPLPRDLRADHLTGGEEFFLGYCQSRGLEPLRLRPVFLQARARGVGVKTFGHYGPRGNELVAEALAGWLSGRATP